MLFGKYSKIFYAFNFRKVAQIQIQIQVYLSVHSAKTRATGHEPTPVSMTVFRGYCRRLGLAFSALNFSRGDNERWQLVAFDSSVCHWSRLNPAVSADQLHSVSHLSRTAIKHRHRSRRRLGGPFQMAGPGPVLTRVTGFISRPRPNQRKFAAVKLKVNNHFRNSQQKY